MPFGKSGAGKGGKGGQDAAFPGSERDARKLIRLQGDAMTEAANRTAAFNFFDRVSPFGDTLFVGTPGTPGFRQVQQLPGAEQALLEGSRDLRLGMQGLANRQLGNSGFLGDAILGGGDLVAGAAPLEQATFDRGLNLLRPEMDRQTDRLENQLIQRGLPRDSEAFDFETERLASRQADALENLALSSVGAGRQEQSRLLQSDLARRQGSLANLNALGLGVPTSFPAPVSTPQISQQAVDVMGPFSLMSQNINAQNQLAADKKASNTQGAASIGSAALMAGMFMSSREFKTEPRPTPPVLNKLCELEIGEWEYKGDDAKHIGPMAEDFNEAFKLPNREMIASVDAMGVCMKAIQELTAEVDDLKRSIRDGSAMEVA